MIQASRVYNFLIISKSRMTHHPRQNRDGPPISVNLHAKRLIGQSPVERGKVQAGFSHNRITGQNARRIIP